MAQTLPYDYGDCLFCGSAIEERLLPREIRWKGDLLVFEDVPTGVCMQCGEKFLSPAVAKKMDATLEAKKRPHHTLRVPVYQF